MNIILDTVGTILDVFSEHGIKANQGLSIRDLHLEQYGWDWRHRENFEKAIALMLDSKLIDWGEGDTLVLTEDGFKVLSHSEG